MTDHIKLLPLPKWMSNYTIPPDSAVFEKDVVLADRMRDYARANVLHHTAPLQAEIEALRAEVAEWKFVAAAQSEAKACAERLADALRELEDREQRDEALLRQALEALELRCGTNAEERNELIPALRERLGVKA